MPYITQVRKRALLIENDTPRTSGELNYVLTMVVQDYVMSHGLEYRTINDALGALEGAKHEFYRRVALPYEEVKRATNGDVYNRLINELQRIATDAPVSTDA